MVGVINPNDTQTLQKQIAAAKEASYQLRPGDPIPAEASSTLHSSATASPTSTPTPHAHSGLSGGAIAGIVVGAVAFLVLCAALFFHVGRTKSLKDVIKDRETLKSPDGQYPRYHDVPFSPNMQYAEAGMGGVPAPAYGQHNATDGAYYGGYAEPQGQGQMTA